MNVHNAYFYPLFFRSPGKWIEDVSRQRNKTEADTFSMNAKP